jgi:hypothetical protein
MALHECLVANDHGFACGLGAGSGAQSIFAMANAQLGRGMGRDRNAQYGSGEQVAFHGFVP